MTPEPKSCVVCGREIQWRKKWERDWDSVRYCSAACRRRKRSTADDAIEAAILDILRARDAGKTMCPSEAAQLVDPDGWRDRMEDARMAGRRLVAQGRIAFTQQGRVVDPSRAKGPVRFRLV